MDVDFPVARLVLAVFLALFTLLLLAVPMTAPVLPALFAVAVALAAWWIVPAGPGSRRH